MQHSSRELNPPRDSSQGVDLVTHGLGGCPGCEIWRLEKRDRKHVLQENHSTKGSSRRCPSCKGKKTIPFRSGSGCIGSHWSARDRQAVASQQTRAILQGTQSLPRPRPLPRTAPRVHPPRRPPDERRDAPAIPRAAPCWVFRSTVGGFLEPPRDRLNESGSIGCVGTSMGVSTAAGMVFAAALRADPPRAPREEALLRPPRGMKTSSSSSLSSS